MVVDSAHVAISIPAERWQRWHRIARAIGNDHCALAKELRICALAKESGPPRIGQLI